jgi:hypothetical protein
MRDKKSQKVFLHCADYFYKHENLKQVDMFGRYARVESRYDTGRNWETIKY